MLFLGAGGMGGSTLESTMHHLLRTHYPNGYRFLKFDGITTNPWNRKVRHLQSTQGRWPGHSQWERLQVLPALAFKLPLSPTSCVALGQQLGFQLLCDMGKPVAPQRKSWATDNSSTVCTQLLVSSPTLMPHQCRTTYLPCRTNLATKSEGECPLFPFWSPRRLGALDLCGY